LEILLELQKNDKLEELSVANNEVGDIGAEGIAMLIQDHPSLLNFNIFNCAIQNAGGNKIAHRIKKNFKIQTISINTLIVLFFFIVKTQGNLTIAKIV
jgi:hypothetical protein